MKEENKIEECFKPNELNVMDYVCSINRVVIMKWKWDSKIKEKRGSRGVCEYKIGNEENKRRMLKRSQSFGIYLSQ